MPATSHAALTVWLAARDREYRPRFFTAIRSEQLITIDGTTQPFRTLSSPAGRWVAVRPHDDLTITIAAHDLDRRTITIDPSRTPPPAFFDQSPRRREAAAWVTLRPDGRGGRTVKSNRAASAEIDQRTLRGLV